MYLVRLASLLHTLCDQRTRCQQHQQIWLDQRKSEVLNQTLQQNRCQLCIACPRNGCYHEMSCLPVDFSRTRTLSPTLTWAATKLSWLKFCVCPGLKVDVSAIIWAVPSLLVGSSIDICLRKRCSLGTAASAAARLSLISKGDILLKGSLREVLNPKSTGGKRGTVVCQCKGTVNSIMQSTKSLLPSVISAAVTSLLFLGRGIHQHTGSFSVAWVKQLGRRLQSDYW